MKFRATLLAFMIFPLMVACGQAAATESPSATPTIDLCSTANLPGEVAQANKLMREFDDYSTLASNTPQSQLIIVIPEMQRILRNTEDLAVPPCMQTLKTLEMQHMNLVIQTLLAFMNKIDVNVINAAITRARELHAKYDVERARLLGVTLTPRPTSAATPQTNNATPAPNPASATNPGPDPVNLRAAPALDAPTAGVLEPLTSTIALGKTAEEQWIQVQVPGDSSKTAWVFASLVQLSIPIGQLPVVNP